MSNTPETKKNPAETTAAVQKPKSVKKTYYIRGVAFDTIEEYVALRKHQPGFTVETHVAQTCALESEYSTKENEIRELWEDIPAMDPKDAFKKYSSNAQRLMTAMSLMGPEQTFKYLKSKIKDTQTIVKVQRRTFLKNESSLNFSRAKSDKSPSVASDLFETKEVTYNDTYTLHSIDKENFGNNSGLEEDVLVLQVQCPSTHQNYFIFVDSVEPQCQDAIGAVAWTMVKDNGECLSKEEYLKLQAEA